MKFILPPFMRYRLFCFKETILSCNVRVMVTIILIVYKIYSYIYVIKLVHEALLFESAIFHPIHVSHGTSTRN